MSRFLKCLDCSNSQNYSNKDDLEAHIAFVHFRLTAYQCEFCEFSTFPTEYAVVKHCAELHGLNKCKVIFNYSAENKLSQAILAEKLKLCVGASENFPVVEMEDTAMAQQMTIDAQCSVKAQPSQITPRSRDVTLNTVTVKREAPESPVEPPAKRVDRRESLRRRNNEGLPANQPDKQLLERNPSVAPDVKVEVVDPLLITAEPIEQSDDEEELDVSKEEPSENASFKPESKVKCTLCSEEVCSRSKSTAYHAIFKHGNRVLFECGYCDWTHKSCQLSKVKRHITTKHRQYDGSVDENNFIDHRKKFGREMAELKNKCFPRKV